MSIIKNRNIRYIRESLSGNEFDNDNHWIEIQAIDSDNINVALNKPVLSSNPYLLSGVGSEARVTDGNTTLDGSDQWGSITWTQNNTNGVTSSMTIDLEQVYTDIKEIKVWHYWGDSRKYFGVLLEVSQDGVTWYTIYDSAISGEYVETSAGKTHVLNNFKVNVVYKNGKKYGKAYKNNKLYLAEIEAKHPNLWEPRRRDLSSYQIDNSNDFAGLDDDYFQLNTFTRVGSTYTPATDWGFWSMYTVTYNDILYNKPVMFHGLLPNTTYTISGTATFTTSGNTNIRILDNPGAYSGYRYSKTFTTNSYGEYKNIYFVYREAGSTSVPVTISDIKFEKGSRATAFEINEDYLPTPTRYYNRVRVTMGAGGTKKTQLNEIIIRNSIGNVIDIRGASTTVTYNYAGSSVTIAANNIKDGDRNTGSQILSTDVGNIVVYELTLSVGTGWDSLTVIGGWDQYLSDFYDKIEVSEDGVTYETLYTSDYPNPAWDHYKTGKTIFFRNDPV